jgi:hypothetical protein
MPRSTPTEFWKKSEIASTVTKTIPINARNAAFFKDKRSVLRFVFAPLGAASGFEARHPARGPTAFRARTSRNSFEQHNSLLDAFPLGTELGDHLCNVHRSKST